VHPVNIFVGGGEGDAPGLHANRDIATRALCRLVFVANALILHDFDSAATRKSWQTLSLHPSLLEESPEQ
jgi:hypothetical protein